MARKQTRSDKYAGGFLSGMEEFHNLSDPRIGKAKRHYFGEVIFIALAAMICGMEGFDDFERFAKLNLKANQGPLHDKVRALFNDAEAMEYRQEKGP